MIQNIFTGQHLHSLTNKLPLSTDAATALLITLQVDSASNSPPIPQGFRVHQKHSLMAIPTGVAGGYGNSLLRHKTYAIDVSPEMYVLYCSVCAVLIYDVC